MMALQIPYLKRGGELSERRTDSRVQTEARSAEGS